MASLLKDSIVNTPELTLTIGPEDIDTSRNTLQGAFRDENSNISACCLIQLLQQQDEGWTRITKKAINDLSQKERWKYYINDGEFRFYSLISDGLVKEKDGSFELTKEFVIRAFLASPKR